MVHVYIYIYISPCGFCSGLWESLATIASWFVSVCACVRVHYARIIGQSQSDVIYRDGERLCAEPTQRLPSSLAWLVGWLVRTQTPAAVPSASGNSHVVKSARSSSVIGLGRRGTEFFSTSETPDT